MGTGRIHKNRSAKLGGDSSHLDKHLWFIELVIQAGVFFFLCRKAVVVGKVDFLSSSVSIYSVLFFGFKSC